MSEQTYRLEMLGISKNFGGVQALKNVDLRVRPGSIHALIGENGAGKSTLIRVLAGVHQASAGEIYVDGVKQSITSTNISRQLGIGVIYQEYALATDLSVAENIYIDCLLAGSGGTKFINYKKLNENAHALLESLGFGHIKETTIVGELSIAYQQVVEICKALSKPTSILVLDEPTALLATNEVEQLFKLLQKLRDQGTSIIYISHRLEEIFRICDEITVLKDGSYVTTVKTTEIDQDGLVNLMVGRKMDDYYPKRNSNIGDVVMEAKGLCAGRQVQNVSYNVRAGEVVGLYGLIGSGRTESALAIYGMNPLDSGEVFVHGKKVHIKNPRQSFKNGVAYLSEDRKNTGVLLNMAIRHNITISNLGSFTNRICKIDFKKEQDYVKEVCANLSTKYASIEDSVSTLSGGNQQKVAIGKILASDTDCIIFDEPTRGVDVGAKVEIYRIINTLAEAGKAVLIISSEMPEIIGMCDRVYGMHEGHITGMVAGEDITEENLIHLAMEVTK